MITKSVQVKLTGLKVMKIIHFLFYLYIYLL